MTNNKPTENSVPVAKIRTNKRISPFWLLPFLAFCVGAFLFFQIIQEQGETIKITFNSGDGLVAGKTQIRYQGLQIGVVKKVNFTDDLKRVAVVANIYPEAKTVLRENTRFWLVKPSASLAGISGIDALVSGNYITLQPGKGDYEDDFVADEAGPIAQVTEGDLLLHLIADDLGSISAGASVYFKKVPVGKIYDYRFTDNNQKVEIDLVIDKAYANLVKENSRFWNISGINANVGLSGVNIEVDSLNAVVQGAIAFDSPNDSAVAQNNQKYPLYSSLQAAKRGIPVDIRLNNVTGLVQDQTPVYYQDLQIGSLVELQNIENDNHHLIGKLLIDPNMSDLLKTHSKIVLRQQKFSLSNLSDLKNALRGYYFEIVAGEGEKQTEFTVVTESELLLQQPNTLVISLQAPESYGVKEGQALYYNGIEIGRLVEQKVDINGVQFKVAVESKYRDLIHTDSQFVAASNLDVNLGVDGLKLLAASPDKWLQGGVRVINGIKNEGKPRAEYPLYPNINSAEKGIVSEQMPPTLTLKTTQLPSIEAGSLVLYRQYEVGKVLAIHPQNKHFDVDILLYPKYRHLLTDKSLFWVESAAQINISANGINIQAAPLMRTLKGAISFDNSGNGKNQTLYANEMRAKSSGQILTLYADDASNLSKGMALRYMGLNIGEIDSLSLDKGKKKIVAKALINPSYMTLIAKEGSLFKLISPQISAGGIENIESLLKPYIDVEIGNGANKYDFQISHTQLAPKYNHGFPIILETSDATNLSTGAPVLYRGVQVGMIHKLELNSLSDRVLVHLHIDSKQQHLVRQNSEFWISSGYGMEVGLSGLSINTGSVQQLLKGGISFSTPSGTVVQPQAQANQHFLLQQKRPEQAKQWNQAVVE